MKLFYLLNNLITVSGMIAILNLIICAVLIVWQRRISKHGKDQSLGFRIFCIIPLLISIIHSLFYNLGYSELHALRMYWPIWLSGILAALIPLITKERFKKWFCVFLVFTNLFACVYVPVEGPYPKLHNYSHQSWSESFINTVRTMEKEYPISDYKGIDYDSLIDKYLSGIEAAESANDAVAAGRVLNEFAFEFYDGHVYLSVRNNKLRHRLQEKLMGNDYGFALMPLDDGRTVAVMIEEHSDAQLAGIMNGTQITKWNGVPIETARENFEMLEKSPVAANDEPMKTLLMSGSADLINEVGFISSDGEECTAYLKSIGSFQDRFAVVYGLYAHYTSEKNFTNKMISDEWGYLRINSEMMGPITALSSMLFSKAPLASKKVNKILENLQAQGMKKLVLDLRANSGGLLSVSSEIAGLFTKADELVANLTVTENMQPIYESQIRLSGDGRWSELPVVVLVNRETVSAGDALALMLSKAPNVTVMGISDTNSSCQATGGLIALCGGYFELYYPVIKAENPDGSVFIDTGTDRLPGVELDAEIPLNIYSVMCWYNDDTPLDYEVMYAVQNFDNKGVN